MRTSEILNRAADLIEERGWATGSLAWNRGDDRPLCIEGGIMAAMGLVFGSDEYGEEGATGVLRECPAYAAVHSYLGLLEVHDLYQWNDGALTAGEQTKESVISTLRTVAVIEAAREDIDSVRGAHK